MLIVGFSIQLARVNSIQGKVWLIQSLSGKYLQARCLFMPVMDFWACNSDNYMSLYSSEALTQILNPAKW